MLRQDLKISSFREEKETRKFVFFGSMAVDADSAKIGDGKEEVGSIPEDHSKMASCAGKSDVGFRRVSSLLRRWIEDIGKPAISEQATYGYALESRVLTLVSLAFSSIEGYPGMSRVSFCKNKL